MVVNPQKYQLKFINLPPAPCALLDGKHEGEIWKYENMSNPELFLCGYNCCIFWLIKRWANAEGLAEGKMARLRMLYAIVPLNVKATSLNKPQSLQG